MSLSTTQYGYIVDPMVPFTDDKGKTIKNGFIRVFMAGTSTPVLTYRNYDGATNQEKIELDNSGRVMHNVIGSKGSLYKVVVYNILHSQENPLLTVDKIAVLGASVTGTTVVTGLDSVTVQEENFLKATVEGTGVELALDPTEVTSEVSTTSDAVTAAPDYVVPLLEKTGTEDSKKISLANLFKFALDWISRLATTVTSFASGDFIAVSNTTIGTRKMSKDTLLSLTAQNALAGNVAPAFDETGATTYLAGTPVSRNGKNYVFNVDHSGAWSSSDVVQIPSSEAVLKVCRSKIMQTNYIPSSLDDLDESFVYIVQRATGLTTTGFPADAPAEGVFKLSVVKTYSSASQYQVEQELRMVSDTSKIWRRVYNTITSAWGAWKKTCFSLDVVQKQIFTNWNQNLADFNDAPINSLLKLTVTSATTTQNIPSDFLIDSVNNGELRTIKSYYSNSDYRIYQELTRDEDNAVWRRTYSSTVGRWGSWSKVDLKWMTLAPVEIFHNLPTNPSDLDNLKDIKFYLIGLTDSSSVSNLPSDYPVGGVGLLSVYKAGLSSSDPSSSYQVVQTLEHFTTGAKWERHWSTFTTSWSSWVKDSSLSVVKNQVFASWSRNLSDLNDAPVNSVLRLTVTSETTTQNIPSDFLVDSANDGELRTVKSYYSNSDYRIYQELVRISDGSMWSRLFQSTPGSWGSWKKSSTPVNLIEIGQGKQYETLRDGFTAAFKTVGAKIIVYPGTYDLVQEYSDVLLAGVLTDVSTPCPLGKGMHAIFLDGAHVTAKFERPDGMTDAHYASIKSYFEPFGFRKGDYILENLEIESKNCRYCVHDDQGAGPYVHKYINCKMTRYADNEAVGSNFINCIGGGLQKHGTVVIEGGYYKTVTNHGSSTIENGDPLFSQQPISYHNYAGADAESSIEIHNVYLADRGYIHIADYGASTLKTKLYVSGCRFGLPILHRGVEADSIVNMEIAAQWNNEQAIAGEWSVDENDRRVATFVPGN